MKFTLGAHKDKLDIRDYKISKILPTTIEMPSKLDYSSFMGKVRDQKDVGACVGFATAGVKECQENIQLKDHINFSPLYIYWQRPDPTFPGMEPRDALDILQTQGIVYEELLPFEGVNCRDLGLVPANLKTQGQNFKIDSYLRVTTITELEKTLVSFGPVLCTFSVYPYMFNMDKKNCTMRSISTVNKVDEVGGHAVICVGFDRDKQLLKFKNSWGCYSDDTEVLTDRGWVLFKDTTDDDLFFTLNPNTDNIETHKRRNYFEYDFDGDMYKFQTSKIDLLVTPNHNMYLKTDYENHKDKDYKFVKADTTLNGAKRYWFKRSGTWVGKEQSTFSLPGYEHNNGNSLINIPTKDYSMNDWLEFIGYYISEGSLSISKCKRGGQQYQIHISQKKKENVIKIKACLERLGFKFSYHGKDFVFSNKQIYLYLKKLGLSNDKYIPHEFKQLPPQQLKILFDALMLGDGSVNSGINGSNKVTYYTISKKLSDDMQELCLKLGLASSIYLDDRVGTKNSNGYNYNYICYQVRIQGTQSRDADTTIVNRSNITKEYYVGKVYCVDVPNHLLYVRRNGKSCWCSNSNWGENGYFYCRYSDWYNYVWDMWQVVDSKSTAVGFSYKFLKFQKGLLKFIKNWIPFGRTILGNK